MNLVTYKNKIDSRKLLIYLKVIDVKETIIPIKIEPDYDLSEYQREIDSDYYITNKWRFNNHFENLTRLEFLSHRLYHQDNFEDFEDNLQSHLTSDSIEENLNIINEIDRDSFAWSGHESDELDEFKLKYLRLRSIDNVNKVINYEGTFFGSSYGLTVLDWGECGFYAKILVEGTCKSLLYNDLLGESYLLYLSGNYKLSHFVAYSAFENFLNFKTDSFDIQERLSEKLKKLFKESQIDTNKNVIYCSIINNFSKQTKRRNDVAHGMEVENLDAHIVEDFLIEITTMMVLYESNFQDFEQLHDQIELEFKRKTQPNTRYSQ